MEKTKTIYTIQVMSATDRPNIWYANKINGRFTAEYRPGPKNNPTDVTIMVFMVNPCQWVYPTDCIVLEKKLYRFINL